VSTLYGQDTVMIAVRVELGQKSSRSQVGNIVVATVGHLGDLPALLDRTGR